MSNSLWPHRLQHHRILCPLVTPGDCPNSSPLSGWCYLTISSSAAPSSFSYNLSKHHSLFQWVGSSRLVAKVLKLQLQHQFFQRIFRVDFLQNCLVWSPCSPWGWNQDRREKHQQPQIYVWYHSDGRKWRGIKEPLDGGEGGEWKSWLKAKYLKKLRS